MRGEVQEVKCQARGQPIGPAQKFPLLGLCPLEPGASGANASLCWPLRAVCDRKAGSLGRHTGRPGPRSGAHRGTATPISVLSGD